MKVQVDPQKAFEASPDPELEALAAQLEAAYSGLDAAVQQVVRAPMVTRPKRAAPCDAYVGAKPKAAMTDEGSASSVAPRLRVGDGVPLHELLASAGSLGQIASGDEHLFAWDSKADTSVDYVSTRKLLHFYESSMSDLHGTLKTMDHDRKEGLWYERYREDLWREIDMDADYYRAEAEYADRMYYDDMYADRLAAEASFATSSYYDYDPLDR